MHEKEIFDRENNFFERHTVHSFAGSVRNVFDDLLSDCSGQSGKEYAQSDADIWKRTGRQDR